VKFDGRKFQLNHFAFLFPTLRRLKLYGHCQIILLPIEFLHFQEYLLSPTERIWFLVLTFDDEHKIHIDLHITLQPNSIDHFL
jgi:hypothetical protein